MLSLPSLSFPEICFSIGTDKIMYFSVFSPKLQMVLQILLLAPFLLNDSPI